MISVPATEVAREKVNEASSLRHSSIIDVLVRCAAVYFAIDARNLPKDDNLWKHNHECSKTVERQIFRYFKLSVLV